MHNCGSLLSTYVKCWQCHNILLLLLIFFPLLDIGIDLFVWTNVDFPQHFEQISWAILDCYIYTLTPLLPVLLDKVIDRNAQLVFPDKLSLYCLNVNHGFLAREPIQPNILETCNIYFLKFCIFARRRLITLNKKKWSHQANYEKPWSTSKLTITC